MLYVIEVGHNQASDRYIRNKKKAVEDAGMQVGVINLPEDATTETIVDTIRDCTWEEDCNAILVQLPLPDHVDKNKVFKNKISIHKPSANFSTLILSIFRHV